MLKLSKQQLKKLQKIELEILEEFDRICTKHNIKYVLTGGSCLGAIRHNGFIPWDDDIDLAMHRKDYNKFLKIQAKELNHDKFFLQSMETDPNTYGVLLAKIRRKDSIYIEEFSGVPENQQGIWIDIFPVDNISDNEFIAKITYIRVFILGIMYRTKFGYKSHSDSKIKEIILRFFEFLSIFISKKRCKKRLNKLINKYNSRNTKKVASYGGRYIFKEIFDRKIIDERIKHKFESNNYYIPKYYDDYLTQFYGDYMKLPPKEKRHPEHYAIKIKFPK